MDTTWRMLSKRKIARHQGQTQTQTQAETATPTKDRKQDGHMNFMSKDAWIFRQQRVHLQPTASLSGAVPIHFAANSPRHPTSHRSGTACHGGSPTSESKAHCGCEGTSTNDEHNPDNALVRPSASLPLFVRYCGASCLLAPAVSPSTPASATQPCEEKDELNVCWVTEPSS